MTLIILGLCLSMHAGAQEVKKGDLRGTWTASKGEPGRTIEKNDGSFQSLMPLTYSVTSLVLKRFGRAIKTTKAFHGMGIDSNDKGTWKLNGDTLNLRFGNLEDLYLIDQSIQGKIFFKAVPSGVLTFGKSE